MIGSSSPRISLYSFFSVLLPGIVFILGLVPFLPSNTSIGSIGSLLPILAIGFALGQAVHTVAVAIENSSSRVEDIKEMKNSSTGLKKCKFWFKQWFMAVPLNQLFGEQYFNDTSHRSRWISELNPEKNNNRLDTDICNSFYDLSRDTFPELELPDSRKDLFDDGDENKLDLLYANVRSVVHIDGRGRSRSFQAIYSFCRSMWIVSISLFLLYALYSILSMVGVLTGSVSYTSFIGTLGIRSAILASTSFIIAVGSFKLFRSAKNNYQEYYIQYLVSDFLILQNNKIASGQEIDLSHKFDDIE